jgi:hypothetical protein
LWHALAVFLGETPIKENSSGTRKRDASTKASRNRKKYHFIFDSLVNEHFIFLTRPALSSFLGVQRVYILGVK